jgi:hypothetical protein
LRKKPPADDNRGLHAQIGINLLFLQDLGWDRQVAATGEAAKRIKETINRQRISPPRSRGRQEILDAAAPLVQASPDQRH